MELEQAQKLFSIDFLSAQKGGKYGRKVSVTLHECFRGALHRYSNRFDEVTEWFQKLFVDLSNGSFLYGYRLHLTHQDFEGRQHVLPELQLGI